MAATGWMCDMDVATPVVGSSLHSMVSIPTECAAVPATKDRSLLSNTGPTEPASKRSRLTGSSFDGHGISNGFPQSSQKNPLSDSAENRLGLTDRFRVTFGVYFKNALKEKLSTYLSRLDKAEESVCTIQKELTELSGRMNAIDTSSLELKKFVMERVSLPAPTSGVGQRRTLSSQAPRLPPPPPLASALDPIPPTPTALTSVPSRLTPALATRPSALATHTTEKETTTPPRSVLTDSTVLNNSISAPLLRTTPAYNSPQMSSLQKTVKAPSVTVNTAPLRVADTIDLTVESTATGSALPVPVQGQPPNLDRVNGSNMGTPMARSVVPSVPPAKSVNPSGLPNVRSQTAPASVRGQTLVSSKPTPGAPRTQNRTTTAQLTNVTPPAPPQHSMPVARPRSSVLDLNPLPVAPLPPLPYQPKCGGLPVQPLPLLTIAEAAEGICLQWNISQQSSGFEPAVTYEIYSYASSELTASNIYTHLPWKKVGEVTALPLPMACTLTHVQSNNLYYFAVRSIDRFRRYSHWSNIVNAVVS